MDDEYLTKEDLQRFRKHMESRGPTQDKIWIPLPKWQIDILIDEGLIVRGDIEASPPIINM